MHNGFFRSFTCCLATLGNIGFCRNSVLLTAKKRHCQDDTGGQRLNEGTSHLLTWTTVVKEATTEEETVEEQKHKRTLGFSFHV